MLSVLVAVAAHLSPPGGYALTESDPFGQNRLASTLAAADLAADAAGRVRASIRETYIRKFAEAAAAVQTVQNKPKGTRAHAKALRLLATVPSSVTAAPKAVPPHQNRHKKLKVAPAKHVAKDRNHATKKHAGASILKKKGSALIAKNKGPNGSKAKASAQRKGKPQGKLQGKPQGKPQRKPHVVFDNPMAKVAKMAVAAVQKESVLRQQVTVAKVAAQEEVAAEKVTKATLKEKAEALAEKVEAASEAKAIAEIKIKKADAVQAKEDKKAAAVQAAEMKKQRQAATALRAVKEGEEEMAMEAQAKEQAQTASIEKKTVQELAKKLRKGHHKAMETKAIRAMETAIKKPIQAEKLEAEKERRAEAKARKRATAKRKRKTNELKVSLGEAQMIMQTKEADEVAKKEAEEAATKKTAEDIAKTAVAGAAALEMATAQQLGMAAAAAAAQHTALRETASPIAQATVGVNGCRSLEADQTLDRWCANNCKVGFCPAEKCTCATQARSKSR